MYKGRVMDSNGDKNREIVQEKQEEDVISERIL
jgi:hypothetical protein